MRIVELHDFTNHFAELMRQNEAILVFQGKQPAGVFIPWPDIAPDGELRNAAMLALHIPVRRSRSSGELETACPELGTALDNCFTR